MILQSVEVTKFSSFERKSANPPSISKTQAAMSSRSVALDLPVHVLVRIFTEFLTLPEVGRLDTVYCARTSRKVFTTILRSKELTFSVDFIIIRNVSAACNG